MLCCCCCCCCHCCCCSCCPTFLEARRTQCRSQHPSNSDTAWLLSHIIDPFLRRKDGVTNENDKLRVKSSLSVLLSTILTVSNDPTTVMISKTFSHDVFWQTKIQKFLHSFHWYFELDYGENSLEFHLIAYCWIIECVLSAIEEFKKTKPCCNHFKNSWNQTLWLF